MPKVIVTKVRPITVSTRGCVSGFLLKVCPFKLLVLEGDQGKANPKSRGEG